MRNLLSLAALGLVVFFGVGWLLGWYKVHSTTTADGHRQIGLDLNSGKIEKDVVKGEKELHDVLVNQKGRHAPQANVTVPGGGTVASFGPAEGGSFEFPGANPTQLSEGPPPLPPPPLPPPSPPPLPPPLHQ